MSEQEEINLLSYLGYVVVGLIIGVIATLFITPTFHAEKPSRGEIIGDMILNTDEYLPKYSSYIGIAIKNETTMKEIRQGFLSHQLPATAVLSYIADDVCRKGN